MIEKMYLYSSDTAENFQNFFYYLNRYAVPKYFSRVTLESEKIRCYVGGEKIFLEFTSAAQATSYNIHTAEISPKNGAIAAPNGSGTCNKILYAFKTDSSISFSGQKDSGVTSKIFNFTITKDDENNTVVIATSTSKISTGTTANTIFVTSPDTIPLSFSALKITDSVVALTGKIPFPVGNSTNYTPDVFLIPYAEYTNAGVIEMDNVKYISNGLWCCKE